MIKMLYMLFLHPILFFKYGIKNRLIVRGHIDITIHEGNLKLGRNIRFGYDTRINVFGGDLCIGNNSYFVNRNTILVGGDINIGNDVLVGSDTLITSENHSINPEDNIPYKNQALIRKKVSIDDGCWIGEKAVILPGVEIGKKCVIGAGAIVTKDIPDYSIAVGNPARVIKKYSFELGKWERIDG